MNLLSPKTKNANKSVIKPSVTDLEDKIENLESTINHQQNTINALQKTNQILSEQVEELTKQLDSVNDQFINSRGLGGTGSLNSSLSITQVTQDDDNNQLNAFGQLRRHSSMSQIIDDNNIYQQSQAQSILNEDEVYSSGDDCEMYKTIVQDDHELLPLKQGSLKKKSEQMHRYNTRYVILYSSFLLYYDSSPIKIHKTKTKRKGSSFKDKIYTSSKSATTEINHPKGTLYLRNYHVAVRKDTKKNRFDITFVPHSSAVAMGLANVDAKIRFRCKNLNQLNEWTDKIRAAITSSNSGFIQYDVRTDIINNDLSNLGSVNNKSNSNINDKSSLNGDNDQKVNNSPNKPDLNDIKTDENVQTPKSKKMFGLDDLKGLMKEKEELQNEIQIKNREISRLEDYINQLKSDLDIKISELNSQISMSSKKEADLLATIEDLKAEKDLLSSQMSSLRNDISSIELKYREQHKKLKKYKHHEEDIVKNIKMINELNKKMNENSLQYLGQIYPNYSSKQLFETCQQGCVQLLEETYNINKRKISDNSVMDDDINKKKKKRHHHKQSSIIRDMLSVYMDVFRRHIKITINYASLQQAHNATVKDFKIMKKDFEELENDDNNYNSLNDDALIMASMTASLF